MAHNHLSGETSPYLLQHADNPVDWYPWGEEALQKARTENKPILLSIGYSACHWCHVMAHESFEEPVTAAVMNELFVNIKVDREERPDIDRIYQLSYQLLMRRPGGWPLNMFLTPDQHIPFFGGTYFPDRPAYNLPAFVDILRQVAAYYREQQVHLAQHTAQFERTLKALSAASPPESPERRILTAAREELESQFDPQHGGFGQAPKFPNAPTLDFLLRHWEAEGSKESRTLHMAVKTLECMAKGGIYDQLDGGFCRYSVDERWLIPHFEKMLYDNGQLLSLYVQAWQATSAPLFEKTALATAAWVMKTMQSPEGGYYSSLDADSEGEEGKYYVWTQEEVKALLSDEEWRVASQYFGLDRPANFEGQWHLFASRSDEAIAGTLELELETVRNHLRSSRRKLSDARRQRVRPGRDEKILTSWNGLMIRGMSLAGRVFGRKNFAESAARAFAFIKNNLWRDGRLLATCKDGKAHLNAYLDDYAYMLDAGIELLQMRWNTEDLAWLMELADCLLDHFEDTAHGGFFFTADDHEALPLRPKPFADDATPAGNAIAALALGHLGRLVGNQRYLNASRRTVDAAMASVRRMPHAHCALLAAAQAFLLPHATVVIRGDDAGLWQQTMTQDFHPRRLCFAIPRQEQNLPGSLAAMTPFETPVAYICTEAGCLPPITGLAELQATLPAA